MASVSSLGSGSGLDLSGLLTKLMTAEQQPLIALQTKEASYQARISGLGSLKSALSSLQSAASSLKPSSTQTAAEKYSTLSAKIADSSIATVTASKGAVAGAYTLEVSSLAKNQRLASQASTGSPSPYTSASSAIATGTLSIELGSLSGSTFVGDGARKYEITIDSSNATLGGLRDAINSAKAGVSATIVTGSAGAQLILTSDDTGTSNVMKLSGLSGFDYDPAAASGSMTQDITQGGQAATNAAFTLNGIAASSTSNLVNNVLDGVSIALIKTTTAGSPTTITVSKDTKTSLTSAINAFVKGFNEAASTISTLGAYDAETDKAGILQGQAILRTSQTQLRNLVFGTTAGGSGAYQKLNNIGVTFDKTGQLTVDSTKLSKALEADFDGVATLVEKIGTAFDTAMDKMVGTSGSITSATKGVNDMIKRLDTQQTQLSNRLTQIEARYRAQFTALDTLVASMQQTSSYLTTQLASLPGAASSK
ncbi:flagellar filament capping protein FliD [Rhodocyclus tenuis]|uniref:Flagellar hook-associated protein 2 n=1 Tax=Rhodocyclus tenuis TaxID=1066 RepID=A0A840GEM2_RHOTE|nr:flagellar filament capping protein FliD [Rhodocyclus tenuis]MBB4246669.1 flagellar hook-associated protein 2 [Rhodocyclus tenuis]